MIALRLVNSDRPEDKALVAEMARQEGLLAAVARFVDYSPNIVVIPGPTGVQEVNLLPDVFLSLLSLEVFPPGALPSPIVSTLARLAAGNQAPAVRSKAADLLRRFIAAGLVSPGDLVPGSVVHGFVHFEAGVQLPCDQCGALKVPGELKRCSRCK
ncbi:hypothetical protein KFL_006680045 [Klebsormidium nitens]|uniref:Uncharacterized protein n=1 Tax=Klebsormidium nitens TaxID=105231 RepID=A0A1Y1IID9_KLENI|nr:hypothetical protein KFL_006680045 [Klebsormidium nitens]|eukprot:GAQ90655.1 hypothetical protein KFL_006680045 [Klebsormidium nitens]